MFGGGGASAPEAKTIDTGEQAKQQSEAEANQRRLARTRKGRSATRLTDPIVDLTSGQSSDTSRVSLLGGGEYRSGG